MPSYCATTRISLSGVPAKALSVVPPSAEAARPVEAVVKVVAGGSALRMCFSSSDLPVPVRYIES